MAEREIERWVTINGNHVPIYKDNGSSDKEIGDYANIIGNRDKAMELYKRTGINMSGNLAGVNPEVMSELCVTLENLQNKYHINTVPEIGEAADNAEGTRLEVHVPSEYENAFGQDNDPFANARLGHININQKYFGLPKEDFDAIYAAGTEGFENFHAKGTTAKGIIAHEAAHHMLDEQVWKMCGHDSDKYSKVQEFLVDEAEYTAMGENTMPEIKQIFGKFDKVRKSYIKQLKKDPDAVKYLGMYLGDHRLLREMANPFHYGKYGICKYAGKNYHELVAESFQDFYENGKEARPLSRMIVKEFFGFE